MLGEKSYVFLRNCFCLREPPDDIAVAPSAQLLDDITSVAIGTAMSVVRATDSLYQKKIDQSHLFIFHKPPQPQNLKKRKKGSKHQQKHQSYCLYFFPNFT